ncbi:hypothetical protein MFERI15568_00176 [Mycoplasma feriruminatoris]|uniref:hypothetical protein n=1 Tax=Mycoplasma feriruminatoris TaxID=1179777 RepID=UPI00241DC823|nr:hypothetical protein [Mycoplasma feriruminatoris]WFQ95760.1 hypothetical protein MFERI15568_00176 [Mycoplasma feriruminatoris]
MEFKEIVKNAVFHKVGTNANSYLKTFKDKYTKTNSFFTSPSNNTNNKIYVYDENEKIIDAFKSHSTYDQFCLTLCAFGYIENVNGTYRIIKKELTNKEIIDNMFLKSSNKDISILRQSRIITFLFNLNIINKNNHEDFELKGKRSSGVELKNLIAETSSWEKQICMDIDLIIYCLEKIKTYDFIKKENYYAK